MTKALALRRLVHNEDINFLLTNRLPRIAATRLFGRYSRIESRWLTRLSLALWRQFADLDLSDAREREFGSLHACFVRELKPGARPIAADPELLVSPCDAIVGAGGRMRATEVFQAKGFPYRLEDLLPDPAAIAALRDGSYVTLRLTSTMYHHFHAPHDLIVERVDYISGDTWNVNPIALRRVERLFCRNERAAIHTRLQGSGLPLLIVPVAAILVASLRLRFVDAHLHLRYRGPNRLACQAPLTKGEAMGWFEHGSTILVFAPPGVELLPQCQPGTPIRMGEPLFRLPPQSAVTKL